MSEKLKQLLALDVSGYTEKKGGLTYLSWSNAWREFVKVYPDATYEVMKDENGQCWFGNTEQGFMTYTSVTADDITREMWLPVMDHRNKAVKNPDSFQINKAVMRCLTKNLAMFGCGLSVYAGEDLPEANAEAEILFKQTGELYAELRGKFTEKYQDEGQAELDKAVGEDINAVRKVLLSKDEKKIAELYDKLVAIKL